MIWSVGGSGGGGGGVRGLNPSPLLLVGPKQKSFSTFWELQPPSGAIDIKK